MEHTIIIPVMTLMVIPAAACLAPRLGVPAQLILGLAYHLGDQFPARLSRHQRAVHRPGGAVVNGARGAALGAILSPTDAVATSIIKGCGVPGRAALILEGESPEFLHASGLVAAVVAGLVTGIRAPRAVDHG